MTTSFTRVSAVRQKTQTKTYELEVRVKDSDTIYSEAVFLVNDYLKSDSTLKQIMGNGFNIFPNVADEPIDGVKSFPYIRYMAVPGIGPIWRVRTDIIRYYVGDDNFMRAGKVMQRLIELFNIEESDDPLPINNGKWKVQSLAFLGGTQPTLPDQDNGVMERGVNVAMIYTQIS